MLKNAMLALACMAMIAGAGVIGATLAQGDPDGGGAAEEQYTVRISAQRLASGSVAVGLQEQGAGGAWQERELPANYILPADAPAGRWSNSSPLGVGGALRPVCIIHHGGPADTAFWGRFGRDAADAARHHGLDARVAGEIEHARAGGADPAMRRGRSRGDRDNAAEPRGAGGRGARGARCGRGRGHVQLGA